jgi:hypothetical protein
VFEVVQTAIDAHFPALSPSRLPLFLPHWSTVDNEEPAKTLRVL